VLVVQESAFAGAVCELFVQVEQTMLIRIFANLFLEDFSHQA